MVEIGELDVADDVALREFHDVELAARSAERRYDVPRTWPQLLQMVRRPSPYFRRVLLVAREDGRTVGIADLGLPQQDNRHLCHVGLGVLPAARGRGIGTALHEQVLERGRREGRKTFLGEVYQPDAGTPSAGVLFAQAQGYDVVHREDHQVLDLPVDLRPLPTAADGYEVVTWTNRAPDALLEAYARMRTQLLVDIPSGEVDHEPVHLDGVRLREEEERTAHAYDHVVAVARRTADGELAGYTKVFLPFELSYVVQDDTMVMSAHRGRGLGLLLKSTVLRHLAARHPERQVVHTWNAVENAPMKRINGELGFRPVELALEMQHKHPDA